MNMSPSKTQVFEQFRIKHTRKVVFKLPLVQPLEWSVSAKGRVRHEVGGLQVLPQHFLTLQRFLILWSQKIFI